MRRFRLIIVSLAALAVSCKGSAPEDRLLTLPYDHASLAELKAQLPEKLQQAMEPVPVQRNGFLLMTMAVDLFPNQMSLAKGTGLEPLEELIPRKLLPPRARQLLEQIKPLRGKVREVAGRTTDMASRGDAKAAKAVVDQLRPWAPVFDLLDFAANTNRFQYKVAKGAHGPGRLLAQRMDLCQAQLTLGHREAAAGTLLKCAHLARTLILAGSLRSYLTSFLYPLAKIQRDPRLPVLALRQCEAELPTSNELKQCCKDKLYPTIEQGLRHLLEADKEPVHSADPLMGLFASNPRPLDKIGSAKTLSQVATAVLDAVGQPVALVDKALYSSEAVLAPWHRVLSDPPILGPTPDEKRDAQFGNNPLGKYELTQWVADMDMALRVIYPNLANASAMRLWLALRIYKREHRDLPPRLQDLPEFRTEPAIVCDPSTGHEFGYSKQRRRLTFEQTLYSRAAEWPL
jgi:hypothetical protein